MAFGNVVDYYCGIRISCAGTVMILYLSYVFRINRCDLARGGFHSVDAECGLAATSDFDVVGQRIDGDA